MKGVIFGVLWSDETKTQLFFSIWMKKGAACKSENTIPAVKYRGGSIMGIFFSAGGNGAKKLIESAWKLKLELKWILRMDPKNTTKLVKVVERLELI